MLWVPATRLAVLQVAIFVALPLGSATAPQPVRALSIGGKADTAGRCLDPVTVAVKVTLAPTVDGLAELASVVVVGVTADCSSPHIPGSAPAVEGRPCR